MSQILTLDELQKQFEQARDKLSRDRQEMLTTTPLTIDFNRDEYSFSYMKAERIGLEIIVTSLKEVSWLPMRLDPRSEIILENRGTIKKWLNSSSTGQPNSSAFGNDFVHALTRVAVTEGWDSCEFKGLALRIGELFRDLSCLIGLIYYGVWMAENGIHGLPITNPEDLERTAQEIAQITRSAEVAQFLAEQKKGLLEKIDGSKNKAKKDRAHLRVVDNSDWDRGPTSPLMN